MKDKGFLKRLGASSAVWLILMASGFGLYKVSSTVHYYATRTQEQKVKDITKKYRIVYNKELKRYTVQYGALDGWKFLGANGGYVDWDRKIVSFENKKEAKKFMRLLVRKEIVGDVWNKHHWYTIDKD